MYPQWHRTYIYAYRIYTYIYMHIFVYLSDLV